MAVELKKWTIIKYVTFTCEHCGHFHDLDTTEEHEKEVPFSTEDSYVCDSCGKKIEFNTEDTEPSESW